MIVIRFVIIHLPFLVKLVRRHYLLNCIIKRLSVLGSTCENQIFFKEKDPQLITKDLVFLFFHKGLEAANSFFQGIQICRIRQANIFRGTKASSRY